MDSSERIGINTDTILEDIESSVDNILTFAPGEGQALLAYSKIQMQNTCRFQQYVVVREEFLIWIVLFLFSTAVDNIVRLDEGYYILRTMYLL